MRLASHKIVRHCGYEQCRTRAMLYYGTGTMMGEVKCPTLLTVSEP